MYFHICLIFVLTLSEAKIRLYFFDSPVERIGSRVYKKELLTNKYHDPKELVYDSDSRNLFFMHMDDKIQNSGRAFVNIITKKTMKVNGIEKNKATAIDIDTGEVYFGSENGLYKYDPLTNYANNIGLYNVNIMKLIVRNNEMFLLDANDHRIYKVYNEGAREVLAVEAETVMQFDVDNERNIHFVTMCGLFCLHNGEVTKNKDLSKVYLFVVSDNKTYGIDDNGIFDINCRNGTASRVLDLNFIPSSLIFGDYGDIFYSKDDNIYRLKPVRSYVIYNINDTNVI